MSADLKELLDAVEKACREELAGYGMVYVLTVPSDREEMCTRYGAVTPRVAVILGKPMAVVRQRMQRLVGTGLLLRDERDRRGSMVTWWVPGLLAKLKAEKEQA